MDQQPEESASGLEASAVEVHPPEEPKARPPRRRRLALILSALAILLLVGVSFGRYLVITHTQHPHAPTTGARLTPTATLPLAERWRVVDSPTTGKDSTWLSGAAASSPTDAWAWGAGFGLLHWDGQSWKARAIPPDPHLVQIYIGGMAALSPDNAWLVGSAETVQGGLGDANLSCLLMHWDGHQWSQTPPPAPLLQHQFCELDGITALSATDIWAVGSTGDSVPVGSRQLTEVGQTLTMHWDGQHWSIVPAPNPGADRRLTWITARAANDLWAIGTLTQHLSTEGQPNPPRQPLIEHWDGQQWSVVKSPGTTDTRLFGITALAPNDVWAVGQEGEQALTMHWDGQQWSAVSSPTLPGHPQASALDAIAALGPDDTWAVGSSTAMGTPALPPTAVHTSQMLLEHWDGQQWSIIAVQAPGQGSALYGLARVPNTNQLWAVGGWSQLTDLTTPATTLTLLMAS